MKKISFNQFSDIFGVKRNPIKSISNYENTMLDVDEDELDELEEIPLNKQWSLVEGEEGLLLKPGRVGNWQENVIGYFICNKEWKNNKESFILI